MKFIDLSHPVSNAMPTYPSDPDISIIREKDIDTDNTLVHSFKMGTHTGTHLDVPAHIILGGKTLNNFSLTSFTGKARRCC
jgi:kynurenine formamidase